jgi:hypothetical protein
LNDGLLEKLIEYGATATLYSQESLATAASMDTPRIVNAELLDSSLLALWPQMPQECRVLVVILGEQLARSKIAD